MFLPQKERTGTLKKMRRRPLQRGEPREAAAGLSPEWMHSANPVSLSSTSASLTAAKGTRVLETLQMLPLAGTTKVVSVKDRMSPFTPDGLPQTSSKPWVPLTTRPHPFSSLSPKNTLTGAQATTSKWDRDVSFADL